MSAATAENIGLQFRALMDQDVIEDEGVTSTTILLAGLVRLIFHDCVGNGCDGCINMNMTDNRGRMCKKEKSTNDEYNSIIKNKLCQVYASQDLKPDRFPNHADEGACH